MGGGSHLLIFLLGTRALTVWTGTCHFRRQGRREGRTLLPAGTVRVLYGRSPVGSKSPGHRSHPRGALVSEKVGIL